MALENVDCAWKDAVVFLSAVAPNIAEIVQWMGKNPKSTVVSQRPTRMRAGVYDISGAARRPRNHQVHRGYNLGYLAKWRRVGPKAPPSTTLGHPRCKWSCASGGEGQGGCEIGPAMRLRSSMRPLPAESDQRPLTGT